MESVDVYWSFRSPYSYLATPGMLEIKKNYNVDLNLRPVLPVAIRAPETLFNPANAPRARYIQLDWGRRARFLGMSDRWPNPDPIVQDMSTLEVSSDQPYIYRLSYLGVEAQRRGRGAEFAHQVSHLLFGGVSNWHEGDHLAEATTKAGLDLAEMEEGIKDGTHLAEIESNQDGLSQAGHWGVPTFVYQGEPFFGQDRIEVLCWHLGNCGLRA
jgi:2-hydroxychromene-2-carboxylate isomerase